ncbi:MAG TPA: hypothetical protein VIF37_12630 [Methylobacter sp.]|jgi:hypothetical protein
MIIFYAVLSGIEDWGGMEIFVEEKKIVSKLSWNCLTVFLFT